VARTIFFQRRKTRQQGGWKLIDDPHRARATRLRLRSGLPGSIGAPDFNCSPRSGVSKQPCDMQAASTCPRRDGATSATTSGPGATVRFDPAQHVTSFGWPDCRICQCPRRAANRNIHSAAASDWVSWRAARRAGKMVTTKESTEATGDGRHHVAELKLAPAGNRLPRI